MCGGGEPAVTIASLLGPQQDVNVWRGIFFESRTHLVVISGTYDDDIVQLIMLQFLLQYPGLTFQHDNSRLHTARVAVNCFQAFPILP